MDGGGFPADRPQNRISPTHNPHTHNPPPTTHYTQQHYNLLREVGEPKLTETEREQLERQETFDNFSWEACFTDRIAILIIFTLPTLGFTTLT